MISFTKKQYKCDRFETIGSQQTFVKIEACSMRRLCRCRTGRLRKKYGVNKFCLIYRHKSVHQPLRLDEACKSCCWKFTCMPCVYVYARTFVDFLWIYGFYLIKWLCVIKFFPCSNASHRRSRLNSVNAE